MALAVQKPEYQRRFTRHEVHLAVRFETAAEFVTEYAENLSLGGLFLTGGHELPPASIVFVEIDLPGAESYRLEAMVCHILPPEVAEKVGRSPGAGLEIVNPPDDFDVQMNAYLMRLGRRREFVVMVDNDQARRLFDNAGYETAWVPHPDELVAAVVHTDKEVAAVVVHCDTAAVYHDHAMGAGSPDLVLTYDDALCIRDLLPLIDDRI